MPEERGIGALVRKLAGMSSDDTDGTRGADDDKKRGKLVQAAIDWSKEKLGKEVRQLVVDVVGHEPPEFAEKPDEERAARGNPIVAFGKRKAGEFIDEVVTGLKEDRELRDSLHTDIHAGIREGVRGMKTNLKPGIEAINNQLEDETRSTYDLMKNVLGYKKEDSFFVGLAKKVGAKILSIGFPIITFLSAKVASRFTEDTPEGEKDFRKKFETLYKRAIGWMFPASATPAPAGT